LGQSPKVLKPSAEQGNQEIADFWYNLLHQIDFGEKLCYAESSSTGFSPLEILVERTWIMAHAEKYGKGATGHMCKHYERAKDEKGEYIKFGNQDIDLARTQFNYNLAPEREGSQMDFIHQRVDEVYCLKRKDVNVMCSWVVTLPKDVPYENAREFFEHSYDFLTERYGGFENENVISSYVHMDENTPHMHFAFVPIVYDQEKGREKVSAKELITKRDLKTFHTDLERFLCNDRGFICHILNEATRDGNRSIQELKKGTAIEQLNEIQSEVVKMRSEYLTMKNEIGSMQVQKKGLVEEIKGLQEGIKTIENTMSKYQATIDKQKEIIPALKEMYELYQQINSRITEQTKVLEGLTEQSPEIRQMRATQGAEKQVMDGNRKTMDEWMADIKQARAEMQETQRSKPHKGIDYGDR